MTGRDLLFFSMFLGAWFIVNRWVLPRLGVAT
jgi:hypothetical protein